jgi:hypothetical protein
MSTAELASSYAALILADDGIEITVWTPYPIPSQSTLVRKSNCEMTDD